MSNERAIELSKLMLWEDDDCKDAAAELRRLVAENESLRKDAGWRPIETAPKDGTLLLLWEEYDTEPFVGSYGLDGVWYASTTYYNTDGDACVVDTVCSDAVTHWMPLPPPPDAAKEKP